ncbi:hypothetical protein M798_14640 [Brucella melitensis ADMAS-G1]|nr:hypothetical protein M798_14640 [Brucella melitensis ADMAS-G1]
MRCLSTPAHRHARRALPPAIDGGAKAKQDEQHTAGGEAACRAMDHADQQGADGGKNIAHTLRHAGKMCSRM